MDSRTFDFSARRLTRVHMIARTAPDTVGQGAGRSACSRAFSNQRARLPQHVAARSLVRFQSPEPGFGEKYWNLSAFPSHSFQSGGGAFLTAIFGQIFAYSAFSDSHFSSPGSVSALMASTGHSGSQMPQSMHSSGWITSIFSPS